MRLTDSHDRCDGEQRHGSNDKQSFSTTKHSDLPGSPIERLLLQAVRNTAINFRGVDSIATGMRLDHYEEMELNEFVYFNGEVVKLFRMPQGPDSDMLFYSSNGKRRAYLDSQSETLPLS